MTPISRGHASRPGLRKPEPSLAQKMCDFVEQQLGIKCFPHQGFVWSKPERAVPLAHFLMREDGSLKQLHPLGVRSSSQPEWGFGHRP